MSEGKKWHTGVETAFRDLNEKLNGSGYISHFFGMCNECANFFYMEFELGEYKAKCDFWAMKIDEKRKVTKCNAFSVKNSPNIYDMKEIAWEIKDTEKTVGFTCKKGEKNES